MHLVDALFPLVLKKVKGEVLTLRGQQRQFDTASVHCRRYKTYVAAQVTGRPVEEAEALLRAYLDGANARRQRLDLTTPLWRDADGTVSFMLPRFQVLLPGAGFAWRSVLHMPLYEPDTTTDPICMMS